MRARGRSILVLVMIALPVLAVTMADVALHTQDVGSAESLDRRLGNAAALVRAEAGSGSAVQGTDPDKASGFTGDGTNSLPTAAEISRTLGGARLVEQRSGEVRVATENGVAPAEATEVDLRDHTVAGLFELRSGRLPRSAGEVVINEALAEKGYSIGDQLKLSDDTDRAPTVVGMAESTTSRSYPVVVGPLDSLGLPAGGTATWFVDGSEVTWKEVRRLNAGGATVLSRSVVLHPPPDSEIPEDARSMGGGTDSNAVAVAVLVVVMALIEVVLLAGPAFAVGARRQSRSLALLAATGGTPGQARRVVLASAVVLGVTAASLGAVLGIALAFGIMPVLQHFSGTWFGPFQIPWLQLVAIAAFGLLSAVLAAVVPAHIASRQDVVAVLAGRRGDRPASLRSPLIGMALIGVGIAGAVLGASRSGGETLIAGSTIFSVLGMILLIPLVLSRLARFSKRLPLSLRYAVRDAARHRTRTVPAVAAVAATVAGVVALGIGSASDAKESEATYTPSIAHGTGLLRVYANQTDWSPYTSLAKRQVPDVDVAQVRGVQENTPADGSSLQVALYKPGSEDLITQSYGDALGSSVLVSDAQLPPGLLGISSKEATRAETALRSGGLIVLTDRPPEPDQTQVHVVVSRYAATGDGSDSTDKTVDLPATFVQVPATAGPQAIASSAAAKAMGVPVSTVSLVLTGAKITSAQEEAITEGAAAISPDSSFSVERGYQADDETLILQLILAGLGALLMLGGTLTATFLALSDARPDLATLSAVGASPRTRRGVAAGYALVVGAAGSVLGALVGLIPGVAITFPLTTMEGAVVYGSGYASDASGGTGPFLDIPWLLILGLVVLLPLVTAAIIGLTARSRLPLVARLD